MEVKIQPAGVCLCLPYRACARADVLQVTHEQVRRLVAGAVARVSGGGRAQEDSTFTLWKSVGSVCLKPTRVLPEGDCFRGIAATKGWWEEDLETRWFD